MPFLRIRTLGGQSREVECGVTLTIGRDSTNHVVLDDPEASRSHATIRRLGDGCYRLMDMGSANGTLVNDKPVSVPHLLSDGDTILIGNTTIVFCDDAKAAGVPEQAQGDNAFATLMSAGHRIQLTTVLVADIRDSTPMSERMGVGAVGKIFGRWFQLVSESVERNHGVVDKIIGDAVMVRWAAGKESAFEMVSLALRSTFEMWKASQLVNQEHRGILPFEFRIGVGINTGQAAVGNVGSRVRRDYTALGDSVNLAFRLEDATKALKADVVMGFDSYSLLPGAVWEGKTASITVKGKDAAVSVCAFRFDELQAVLQKLSAG